MIGKIQENRCRDPLIHVFCTHVNFENCQIADVRFLNKDGRLGCSHVRAVGSAPTDQHCCVFRKRRRELQANGLNALFHVFTILDDATRAVLAALICPTPDLAAAVLVFRMAANRWGLPGMLYADRASIFDSIAFRRGLAQLGSHRIPTKPRNPEANGKIEA